MSKKKHFERLLLFSGGIDSTYVLWDYLKNNPGKPIKVVHVNMKNSERRLAYEKKASQNIVKHLNELYPNTIHYSEFGFDYGTNRIVQDIEIMGFIIGVVLRDPRITVDKVFVCASKTDLNQGRGYETRSRRRFQIIKAVTDRTDVEFDYPIKDIDREDLIKTLPKKLLNMTWFCRFPTIQGRPCGRCFTCSTTLPVLKGMK